VALEDIYTALRLRMARGPDRVIDVNLEG